MSKILLDYFFPITAIEPTPAASTAFLKQVAIVAKPNGGGSEGAVTLCTSMAQVSAVTNNLDAQQLFNAGMSRLYVIQSAGLNLASILETRISDFFTLLISSDFNKDDVIATQASLVKGNLTFTAVESGWAGNDISIELLNTVSAGAEAVTVTGKKISVAIEGGVSTATQIKTALDASTAAAALITTAIADGHAATAQAAQAEDNLEGGDGLTLGVFAGVVGVSSPDLAFLADQAAIKNRVAFFVDVANGAKSLFFAVGKLLSNALNWRNQQYIAMPVDDGIETLGEANSLFDDKVSFVLSDAEFGERLGLLAAGGKAVVGPYIKRNLELDLQSAALSYISGNQPSYSKKQAALLEDELAKVVQSYIDREWIEAGSVEVKLEQDNFVASGYINIAEPKALWRIFGEMRQSL